MSTLEHFGTQAAAHGAAGDPRRPERPAPPPPRAGARLAAARSERRSAETRTQIRTLRAEAERMRRLLDSAADYAIITLDLEGRITELNDGARAILGYGDGEILGRSGEVFFVAEDRTNRVFVGELCRAMNEGRAPNERWHVRRDGSRFWASGLMMPLMDGDGQPEGFVNVFRDNSAVRAEEERRALLLGEMEHRMKNVLATVGAVVTQTLRHAGVPAAVQQTLGDRLSALAASQELLTRGGWEGAPLSDVVERALAPYGGPGRVAVKGAPVWLASAFVEVFNLAFHELATNAAKHGALSVPEGRVEVTWELRRRGRGTRLVEILWREQGGPPVTPPVRRGFGSRLLECGLAQKLGGTVKTEFRPKGLECRICLPLGGGEDSRG